MFAVHCTTADATVLLSASSIVALRNTERGIDVLLRCHCGELLTVHEGHLADETVAA